MKMPRPLEEATGFTIHAPGNMASEEGSYKGIGIPIQED